MEVPLGPLRGWTLGGIERRMDKNVFGPHSSMRLCHPHPYSPTVCQTWYDYLWRAYDSLGWCGYVHGTVNHFQNFVTGVQRNSIEGVWTHIKKLKTMAQVKICLGRTWWSTCGHTGETLFTHLIIIAMLYLP